MTDKRIRIILDSKGAKSNADALSKSVKGVGDSANAASFAVSKMAAAIGAVIASASFAGIARMVQDFNAMSERVRMATDSVEEFNMVQARLNETANGTYRSLAEAQEIYIQTEASLKGLGYTTGQTLDIVDSMSYAFVRNAASVDRANGAISAFNSATAKGKVEADGWATIVKAIPSIVDDIASATGKSANEIRTLGASGKLALADLTEGFRQAREQNKELADGMQVTLVDAGVRARNAMTNLFVALEEKYGAIEYFTKGIVDAADGLNDFISNEEKFNAALETGKNIAIVLASIIAGRLVSSLVLASYRLATTATAATLTAGAMATLGRAMTLLGGPIGVIAGLATAAVALTTFGDAAKKSSPDVDTLTSSIEGLKRETLALRELQLQDAIRDLEFIGGAAKGSAAQVEFLKMQLKEFPSSAKAEEWRRALIEQEEVSRKYNEQLEQLKKSLADVQAAMSNSRVVPETVVLKKTETESGKKSDAANGEREIASAQAVTRSLEQELALRRTIADIYRSNELGADASFYEQQLAQIQIREAEERAIAQAKFSEEAAQREERLAATLENDKLTQEARLALKAEFDEQELIAAQILEEEKTRIAEEGKSAREELDRIERENKIRFLFDTASASVAILQSFGTKQSKTQKALARISIGIDTAQGVAAGVRLGWPLGIPAVAWALVNGKNALDRLNSAGGGGGSGAISAPSMNNQSLGQSSIPSTASAQQVEQRKVYELRGVAGNDKITVDQFRELMEQDGAVVVLSDSVNDASRRNVTGVTAR